MEVLLIVVVLVICATSLWVLYDASRLGVHRGALGRGPLDMGVPGWFVACEIVWIVGFPMYLLARRRYVALSARGSDGSTAERATVAPPAWYPDPSSPDRQRWWDGHSWTEHTI